MLINYHGQLCEIDTELELGELELDLLQEEKNLDDTLNIPINFLEDTVELDLKEIKNLSREDKNG